jgi:hypothetical protein
MKHQAATGKTLASFSQLLVLQKAVNYPRGHDCLMETPQPKTKSGYKGVTKADKKSGQ